MKKEGLPRAARIRSSREIGRLMRSGKRRRVGPMDVFLVPSAGARPRVGFIVPLYGHNAVERNRLRRRLREIARREWLPLAWECDPRVDVLIRAREDAYGRSFKELRAFVGQAMERPCGA
jgi:ribonuclease P protein component